MPTKYQHLIRTTWVGSFIPLLMLLMETMDSCICRSNFGVSTPCVLSARDFYNLKAGLKGRSLSKVRWNHHSKAIIVG